MMLDFEPGDKVINPLNKEWGIGQGTGKLDQGQVQKLQEELALQVGDRIKMFNKNFATQKSQQIRTNHETKRITHEKYAKI